MSLLRTILILIIIYYVIQLFTRYIIPSLFRGYMDDKMNEFTRNQKNQQKKANRHEGEVTIDYSPDKNRRPNSGKDEYADYEEIKD